MASSSESLDMASYQDQHPNFFNQNQAMQPSEHIQEQRLQESKEKKKIHGNRKLQRYRRKLRKQSMDSQIIVDSINSCIDTNQSIADDVSEPSDQTAMPIANETIYYAPNSINKKNINREHTVIKKKKDCLKTSVATKKVETTAVYNDSIDYGSISDEIFLRMFSTAFTNAEMSSCFINDDEKIQFTRRFTSLIDRLLYVKLQESQWKYYQHIGITKNIWTGRMSKHLAEKFSICHSYGCSRTFIEQRLKKVAHHLQQAYHAIEQDEVEILLKCRQYDDCSSAMRALSSIIHEFVQEKQRPLQYDFEYKREMLVMDATDHQLVRKFFDVGPSKTHIISAKRIWQSTLKQMLIEENIALLEQRLTSNKIQAASNLVDHMIDDIEKMIKNTAATMATSSTTFYSSDELNKLQLLKRDIIRRAIITSRGMADNLKTMVEKEHRKFLVKNRFMESTSEWQQTVFNAIENRRMSMIERSNFMTKHKVATLSDTANNHLNEQTIQHYLEKDAYLSSFINCQTTNSDLP